MNMNEQIAFHWYTLHNVITEKEDYSDLRTALRRIINIYLKNMYIYKRSNISKMSFFFYKSEHASQVHNILKEIYYVTLDKNVLSFTL